MMMHSPSGLCAAVPSKSVETLLIVLLALAFPLTSEASAEQPGEGRGILKWLEKRADASAVLELEGAWGRVLHETQSLQLLCTPEVKVKLPFQLDLTVIGRLRGDAYDRLEPGRPLQLETSAASRRLLAGDRVELELREFYIQTDLGKAFLRIGKQQIVWGQADGLKVLDVVNPQDFREFILDDFADSRIPLWSVNAEIPIRQFVLQLVWIPDRTYHKLPEAGAVFGFQSPLTGFAPPPPLIPKLRPIERPHRFFSDSDWGARVSTFWKGWDLSASYFHHYDDFPVPFRQVSGQQIVISPRYERAQAVGAAFSKALGHFVLRGEGGVFLDRFFPARDQRSDGVVQSNELSYFLGLDWNGIGQTLLSVQLFQSILTEDSSRFLRDRAETNVSLLIRRQMLQDRLTTQALWLQNVNRRDGLFRPKISYELEDNLRVWMGYDLFYGSQEGLFGQFDRADRVMVGMELGF